MPVQLSYPGVYIEELPSSVRTITGVATSIAAFIGSAPRGPTDQPATILSFADFTRVYGGLWSTSTLGYAVQQFFLNGGSRAVIVRVVPADAATAQLDLDPGNNFVLAAANQGVWANKLFARIDWLTRDPTDISLFNLYLKDAGTGTTETFRNVSIDTADPRFVTSVLAQQSQLARVASIGVLTRPQSSVAAPAGTDPFSAAGNAYSVTATGADGSAIGDAEVTAGLPLLDKTDLFNLLCLPPPTRDSDFLPATWAAAIAYAQGRRAVVIVDAPLTWTDPTTLSDADVSAVATTRSDSAALYFPRLLIADPLQENRLASFAPGGVVAGIIARTDAQRGVWKAPAGIDATLTGVSGLAFGDQVAPPAHLTDGDNGLLNPMAVNCLRNFPVTGPVVWGTRTLAGTDALASQWKYLPIRRLALYIEESLFRGTQWVVFEPNDEPLWSQIRLNVGGFLQTLFRQGAFQGSTPKDAYFVKCSSETTTQTDIDNGIVNIIVGFAPLKPAEFVVIQIQQITPQS
ncbi:MAG: phage tail protein [Hydrocarboniphaga sp.]|uniref:phage tail sheath family protein n=1 Tax=Hydrocarboniphaga sp. TaxID=2033016 RepID=UPI00262DA738|nr:phage tail sheath subtilisin-like domain-containing protein [Hydrocarboniphaga sp.]MDB5970542.1 phage tail protein [Hydrocarboniphaga sp.]